MGLHMAMEGHKNKKKSWENGRPKQTNRFFSPVFSFFSFFYSPRLLKKTKERKNSKIFIFSVFFFCLPLSQDLFSGPPWPDGPPYGHGGPETKTKNPGRVEGKKTKGVQAPESKNIEKQLFFSTP